jgi:glucosamine-6-phosphate deaminase
MLKELQVDTLRIRISGNRMLMGSDGANLAGARLRKLLSEKDFLNIVFAAAPSQNEFLAMLVKEKNIDWSRVRAFHMDEYIGLPENAPQAFGNFLKEHFFNRVPLLEVHYLNGEAKDMVAPMEPDTITGCLL